MLREEYPQGIDVAYEGVGGRLRQAAVQNLTPQGRLLGVGYISSYPHTSGYAQNGAWISLHDLQVRVCTRACREHSQQHAPGLGRLAWCWHDPGSRAGGLDVSGLSYPASRMQRLYCMSLILSSPHRSISGAENAAVWIEQPFVEPPCISHTRYSHA